jgi:hypothetical protein
MNFLIGSSGMTVRGTFIHGVYRVIRHTGALAAHTGFEPVYRP